MVILLILKNMIIKKKWLDDLIKQLKSLSKKIQILFLQVILISFQQQKMFIIQKALRMMLYLD